jgi:hypothetical protein
VSPARPKLADPLAVIRGGELPTKVVPVCFATDLVEEYEQAKTDIVNEAADDSESFVGGGRAADLRARMVNLEEEMRAVTVDVTLRALRRKDFQDLKRAHPPRKDDDGKPNPRDQILGVNEETFFEPLLRKSIVDPVLDEEMFRLLVDERLTDAQFNHLTTAAWWLNTRMVDLPFTSAASPKTSTSGPG